MILILNKNKEKLSYIRNAISPTILMNVVGEYTFTFSCTLEYMEYINPDNYVLVDDELFNIVKFKTYRTLENKKMIDIYCEQVSYELLEDKVYQMNAGEIQHNSNFPLSQALNRIFRDTKFTYNLDRDSVFDFVLKDERTKRAVFLQLMEAYNKQFTFNKYDIKIRDKIGEYNGVQFRVGKNIQGIEKIVDKTKKDNEGNPSISYEITVADLTHLYPWDKIKLWDEVKIIDEDLKINIISYVVEIEYNPVNKTNERIVVSNIIPDLSDYTVEVENKIDNLDNEVNDKIDNLDDEIHEELKDTEDKLTLEINKTNDKLEITAKDLRNKDNELNGKIEFTTQHLTTEFNRKTNELDGKITNAYSKIEQTADSIRTEVNRNVTDLNTKIYEANSKIEQTADSIKSEVNRKTTELDGKILNAYSKIEQTADSIRTEVSDNYAKKSVFEQTVENIMLEVWDKEAGLESKIKQSSENIMLEVSNTESKLSSKIEQQADKISMVVDGGGDIRAASIALAISRDYSAISMIADRIEIKPHSGIIEFPYGQDIDCRGGDIRIRNSSRNYFRISGDFDFIYGGSILASITSSGIYFRGKRVVLE